MKIRTIVLIAAVAYAAFLVALIPASVVAERVTAATGGQVAVADAGGTLWNGAARVRFTAAGGWLDVDSVEWHFRPMMLLFGRLAVDATANADGIDAKASIGRSFTAWELDNAAITASVASVATLAPVAARWRPEGRLVVRIPRWEWNDRGNRGEMSFEWQQAAVSLSDVKPLGDFRVLAAGQGAATRITASTLKGPLQVSGEGSAGPAEIRFSGEARADPSVGKALDPLLDLMGPRKPDGSRALDLRVAVAEGRAGN